MGFFVLLFYIWINSLHLTHSCILLQCKPFSQRCYKDGPTDPHCPANVGCHKTCPNGSSHRGRPLVPDTNTCIQNPCLNGGTCRKIKPGGNRDNKIKCDCAHPFTGRFCDIKVTNLPLRKEGETCGGCDCPPAFTMGNCSEGLECVREKLGPFRGPGKCFRLKMLTRDRCDPSHPWQPCNLGDHCCRDGTCVPKEIDCTIFPLYEILPTKNTDDFYDRFSLSKLGKLCQNQISSMERCKVAAKAMSNGSYIMTKGKGHDLPYGCILDNVTLNSTSRKTAFYWNPDGVVISTDKNVRQVCNDKSQ